MARKSDDSNIEIEGLDWNWKMSNEIYAIKV